MGQPSVGNAALSRAEHIGTSRTSGGTETSQYPEERKSTETPRVVASERGRAQTQQVSSGHALPAGGCRTAIRVVPGPAGVIKLRVSRRTVELRHHRG